LNETPNLQDSSLVQKVTETFKGILQLFSKHRPWIFLAILLLRLTGNNQS